MEDIQRPVELNSCKNTIEKKLLEAQIYIEKHLTAIPPQASALLAYIMIFEPHRYDFVADVLGDWPPRPDTININASNIRSRAPL